MPHKDLQRHREYQKVYQEKWRKEHPLEWKTILRKSNKKRYGTLHTKAIARSAHQRKLIRCKIKVFEMYGKECSWCKENRFELLCLDHINNDGKEHRKTLKGWNIYEWLVKQPCQKDKFQVLCFNCNAAKEYYSLKPGEIDYMPWEYWEEISKRRNRCHEEF